MAEEKLFENKVKRFLQSEGAWFIKYWGGAAFTKSGIPDLLVCLNGQFLGVELKAPRGVPTDLQLHTLREIDDAGGYAVLLYPDDFERFQTMVRYISADKDYSALSVYKHFIRIRKEKENAKKKERN